MPIAWFYRTACVVLGALMGLLIVLPLTLGFGSSPLRTLSALVIGTLLGGAVGYRRRESRLFLYFSIVSVALLSGVLVSSLGPSAP